MAVELTQRFSAEFSVRAFLTHHPEATTGAETGRVHRIRVKLADLTTRKHYAGRHAIGLLVNGLRFPLSRVQADVFLMRQTQGEGC